MKKSEIRSRAIKPGTGYYFPQKFLRSFLFTRSFFYNPIGQLF